MQREKAKKYINYIVFPIILLLYPLMQCNIGVDVTDTGYSLGSYLFSSAQMGEKWVFFAFYLANVVGSMLTHLPFGQTMIGMNFYTGLFVSATALISYYFLIRKIPAWIALTGEFMAISLCWCPTVILYNYLTFFFFTIMVICLYKGIMEDKRIWLVCAGVVLGLSVMSRFPNITQAALIIAVWYYGWLQKDNISNVLKNTGACILGFLIGMGAMLSIIATQYGMESYFGMISSLLSGEGSVEGHSLGDMVWPIIDAYFVAAKWFFFIIAVAVGGILLFMILRDRFIIIKKVGYIITILVLFRFLYGRGMFNFRYYAYDSMFQWVAIFLILSLISSAVIMAQKNTSLSDKTLACMTILIIAVTPIGSDNYLYMNMNNLFLVAPLVLYWISLYVKGNRNPKIGRIEIERFPITAILVMVIAVTLLQSVGFGFTFVFRDGTLGEKRDTRIYKNNVLYGMYTNRENAETIEGITEYCEQKQLQGKKVILYGDIPAMSCFLQMPAALSTTWPDLASYTIETMQKDIALIRQEQDSNDRPVIIVSSGFGAWLMEDLEEMNYFGISPEKYDNDEKATLIRNLILDMQYEQTYANSKFALFE